MLPVGRWILSACTPPAIGYKKAELVGALINTTTLILAGLYLMYEAVWRLIEPQEVKGWIVVWLAGLALVIDVITALLTFSMSKGSMNIRAAFIHNVSDALSSVGVIIAGTLILIYQWHWADVVATFVISAYILWQGQKMLRSSAGMLMDGVPEGLSIDELVEAMEGVDGVTGVHHVHVWHMNEHDLAMEAHVVVARLDTESCEPVKRKVKLLLRDRFDIAHSTLELESVGESDGHANQVIVGH